MKLRHLFAIVFMIVRGISAWAQNWIGEIPVAGKSYYLYSVNQNKFLNDNNGLDENASVLWTIGGTPVSNYTLTSENSKQFAMYRSGNWPIYKYNVETNATDKSESDINMSSAITDGKFSIYRADQKTNWSGNRNVASTSTGLKIQANASNEWLFISKDQVDGNFGNYETSGTYTPLTMANTNTSDVAATGELKPFQPQKTTEYSWT